MYYIESNCYTYSRSNHSDFRSVEYTELNNKCYGFFTTLEEAIKAIKNIKIDQYCSVRENIFIYEIPLNEILSKENKKLVYKL